MRTWLSLLALLLAGCASVQPDPLPAPVRAELAKQQLTDSALAFVAWPLDAPSQGLKWQSERAMLPASTMKVVTGIVALDKLGPNWRGRTELLAAGALQDGVLDGPLVLRGGFDATLNWGALAGLLREAREAGVREVRGGLIVDRSRAQPAREDVGLAPFDEAPEFPYNTLPDALNLNGNELTLVLSSVRSDVKARWSPAWPGLTVDASQLTLSDRPCTEWENDWQPADVKASASSVQVQLKGQFPKSCTVRQDLNLIDRQVLAAQAVRQLWAELGGSLAGEVREGLAPADARPLAQHRAPPLAEWLRGAMKSSDNPLTRLAFLALGAAHPEATRFASTRLAADAQVRDWLRQRRIDDRSLVLDNGSGLSRIERFSPQLLAQMLAAVANEPNAPELTSSLPLAGRDGTLSRRMKGSAAEARARLKTGTLRDAAGLAGYVQDAANRRWVVVALVNDPNAPAKGRPVLDALMAHIAALK
jgi:serine-type D-Ala-D-Ala carboxypeptidase/endopeptidase (penicillin-binding protein 4)